MMMRTPEVRQFINEKLFEDPVWKKHKEEMPSAYVTAPLGTTESTISYQLGNRANGFLSKHPVLKPIGSLMSNAGQSTANTAMIGAALGGAAGLGKSLYDGSSPMSSTAIGALVGGGGGALLSKLIEMQQRKKYAFYAMGDAVGTQEIQTKLFSDMSIGGSEKASLMQLVSRLDPSQQNELSSVLRGTVGASIGFVIARYLLGLGITGTVIMSILGGGMGSRASGLPSNAFGQRTNTEFDVFGRRRLLY